MTTSNTSKVFYKSIAPNYVQYSGKRSQYLRGIEDQIFQFKKKSESYLDVGTGDGHRAIRIAKRLTATKVVLLDNSRAMLELVPHQFEAERVNCSGEDYKSEIKFDLITCLWNVFGHIDSSKHRVNTLTNMSKHLQPKGVIAIDINNRYNCLNYGWNAVLKNFLKDICRVKRRGIYKLNFDDHQSEVFIHNIFEFDALIKKVGLKILNKKYINYDTGSCEKSPLRGQILYFLGLK